jgi:hypothetical protein
VDDVLHRHRDREFVPRFDQVAKKRRRVTSWALIALLVVALFRPPRVDVWWAWGTWLVVCVALIVGAMALSIAERAC